MINQISIFSRNAAILAFLITLKRMILTHSHPGLNFRCLRIAGAFFLAAFLNRQTPFSLSFLGLCLTRGFSDTL